MSRITTYNPKPISFTKGDGAYLYNVNNQQFLDFTSGIAVCNLGHSHPKITKTIQQQAANLLHCSNMFTIDYQIKLADQLCELTGMSQAFFANSGAEMTEAALKCIRLFANKQNIENPQVIVANGAFHGRTFGAISVSNQRVQKGFSPLLDGFIHVPFNDIQAIQEQSNNKQVAAVFLEPIQGENGIIVPDDGYLEGVHSLCEKNNWLFALDEVQTGIGRTGSLYEYMQHNVQPDLITSAKGLGNGYPIGACLMQNKACDLFTPGSHGSTFGGNPMACKVGISVLETMLEENIIDNVKDVGNYLANSLTKLAHPAIQQIRGKGLMFGVELDKPCKELVAIAIQNNLLINVTADKVIRLLPPLIISNSQVDEFVEKMQKTLDSWN